MPDSRSLDVNKYIDALSYNQRAIIEQLLGITILSEKAEALKDAIKISKDSIATENTRIETVKASNERIQQSIESLIRKQRMWEEQKETSLTNLLKSIDRLSDIDIDQEIVNQRALADWNANKKEHESLASLSAKQTSALEKEQRILDKLERELVSLTEHKCHTCGQELHDSKHTEIMSAKSTQIKESRGAINEHLEELSVIVEAISLLGELGACPAVTYDNLEQALNHKNTLGSLERDITIKTAEENPYDDQIVELKETAVQEIDWNGLNELVRVKDHQEFLHKLLTNKDSFVRKRIIDQNLAFLNQRLTYYLDKIGLPHTVEFQNDLTVIITQLGQDLDFDNLSRGERNRLILSLSWAFRDVWENLYTSINLLFIDELVDSGMDASGVESSIAVLKRMTRERDKNVFLISHRDDLTSRVNHVLKVIKENGFTSYSNDIEILA
jgi:DNA repair exonuclease SbcCD ATPase subunit